MLDFFSADRSKVVPLALERIRPQAANRNRTLAWPRTPFLLAEGIEMALVPDGRLIWEGAGERIDIAFTVGGEVGYVTTVTPVVQRLLARADIRVRPDQLDAELAAMVIETVLIDRIETIERQIGAEIALLNLDRREERASLASLCFELRMTDIGTVYPGMIHAPASLLSLIARSWTQQPAQESDGEIVTFMLACRVAFTDLASSALRELGVGDAMLFDRVAVPGGAAVVVAEALHAVAKFDGEGILYLSEPLNKPEPYALGEFLMTEEDDHERPVQAVMEADIDDLPVRLVFEVARQNVTLEELRSLGVGAPIPLDRPASSAVQIFANGRRIGAGEMVMIGDQLGVRVTQLNGNA